MLGNFTYCNPTKLYFGQNAIENLKEELKKYGPKVMLIYGGGSIKRNGIYDDVMNILKECKKEVVEDNGVMPNPTVEKLSDGAKIARDNQVDLILAVGGGSVIDYAKAVSASAYCKEDPWEKYYIRNDEDDCQIIPMGCILTMVGTGSEMNGGAVITNYAQNLKIGHVFKENVFPKFAILNPEYTFTVSEYQMVSGIFDIMSHILEQYLSDFDDNTSDYIAEGLMRSLIHSSKIAKKNPRDYEARSNIMWTSTWALNTVVEKGKKTDWEVHMIGQAIGARTDAAHGMTLSAVTLPYFYMIMPYGLEKFKRFAINVWGVSKDAGDDKTIATLGLKEMEKWMNELGLVMNVKELGVDSSMLDKIADSTFFKTGGYKVLNHEEVVEILKSSLNYKF